MLGKQYLAHRVIWFLVNNYWAEEIDHIDRNRQNNKISNLRDVPHKTNTQNVSKHKDNTSGVKGVSWDKKAKKWHAKIQNEHIGYFNNLDEAKKAYEVQSEYRFK